MSNTFTWFEKFGDAIAGMPKDKGDELIAALVRYGALGEEPEFDDWALESMFVVMRDDIECSVKSRNENKGGRPKKTKDSADAKPPVSDSAKPPVSGNENPGFSDSQNPPTGKKQNPIQDKTIQDNTEDLKELPSGRPDDSVPYSEIVGYLNAKAGTAYKPSGNKTRTVIRARWGEGFRLDDFRAVVDAKTAEWKGDERMSRYLRPETLFGTKFEGYLQTAPLAATAKQGAGALSAAHAPDYTREGW